MALISLDEAERLYGRFYLDTYGAFGRDYFMEQMLDRAHVWREPPERYGVAFDEDVLKELDAQFRLNPPEWASWSWPKSTE